MEKQKSRNLIRPVIIIFLIFILYLTFSNFLYLWIASVLTLISKYSFFFNKENLNTCLNSINFLLVGPQKDPILLLLRTNLDFLICNVVIMLFLSFYYNLKGFKIIIEYKIKLFYLFYIFTIILLILYEGYLAYNYLGGIYFSLKTTLFLYILIMLYIILFISTIYCVCRINFNTNSCIINKIFYSLFLFGCMTIVISTTFFVLLSSKMSLFYINFEVLETPKSYVEIFSFLLKSYLPVIYCSGEINCEELAQRLEEDCRITNIIESLPVQKGPPIVEGLGSILQAYVPRWTDCGEARAIYQVCLQNKAIQRRAENLRKQMEAEISRKVQEELSKLKKN